MKNLFMMMKKSSWRSQLCNRRCSPRPQITRFFFFAVMMTRHTTFFFHFFYFLLLLIYLFVASTVCSLSSIQR